MGSKNLIHIYDEIYLTIKNEIAGKAIELESILLNETVQSQVGKHCVYTIVLCS